MSSHRSYLQKQVIWLGALDAFCLIVGVISGVAIRLGSESIDAHIINYFSGWIYLVVAVLASNYMTGSYGLELRLSRFNMVINWLFSMFMGVLVVSITSYAWFSAALGRGVLGLTVLVYSVLWLSLRLLIYHYLFRKETFCYRVAVLGAGSRAIASVKLVQNVHLRPKHIVVAMIQIDQDHGGRGREISITHDEPAPALIHCSPAHLAATVRSLNCDVLLVAVEREQELSGVYPQMRRLRFEGVSVLSPLNVAEVYSGKVPLTLVDELWLMNASQGHISPMAMRGKRVIDIFLILLSAPVTLYFGLLTALIIKLSAPCSPVFYLQERVGRFGRIFKIYKFRTMAVDAEHMSLVGPRPERPEMVEKLEKTVPYYRERENLLPGLTGWAQIRYPYGATIEDARAKLEYDLYYLQNLSVALDLRIILRTLRIVVFGLERENR